MLHATAVWLWFCPDEVGSLGTQKKLDPVMSCAGQRRVKAEDWLKSFRSQMAREVFLSGSRLVKVVWIYIYRYILYLFILL